jgi:hypothetical protein
LLSQEFLYLSAGIVEKIGHMHVEQANADLSLIHQGTSRRPPVAAFAFA